MEFEQPVLRMNGDKICAAFHAFDRHPLVMGRGFVNSSTGGANGIEHHSIVG